MELVKFKYDTKSSLPKSPTQNGMIHAVVDTKELYIDAEGKRLKFSDIEVHETEEERRAILAPLSKFHYCKDSGNLWYKNGVWKLVGSHGSTKTIKITIDTGVTHSSDILEAGWLVRKIVFVPITPYTGDAASISVKVGSQDLLPENDLNPTSVSTQYESGRYIALKESGAVTVTTTGGGNGTGILYLDYTIL